uniref:Uncharacterized protein n=1 Tax=Timema genevievae TaxID=629358 RepID=A0A7R9PKJ6_TIMGE|nr:unnamed protein product [Timema genevievae]
MKEREVTAPSEGNYKHATTSQDHCSGRGNCRFCGTLTGLKYTAISHTSPVTDVLRCQKEISLHSDKEREDYDDYLEEKEDDERYFKECQEKENERDDLNKTEETKKNREDRSMVYEGEYFPGVVKEVEDKKFYVSAMKMSGFNWKWYGEGQEDLLWYQREDNKSTSNDLDYERSKAPSVTTSSDLEYNNDEVSDTTRREEIPYKERMLAVTGKHIKNDGCHQKGSIDLCIAPHKSDCARIDLPHRQPWRQFGGSIRQVETGIDLISMTTWGLTTYFPLSLLQCRRILDDDYLDTLLDDGIHGQKLHENVCYQEISSQADLRKVANDEKITLRQVSHLIERREMSDITTQSSRYIQHKVCHVFTYGGKHRWDRGGGVHMLRELSRSAS